MSTNSSIEWTQNTWSPLRARVKKDAGAIAAAKGYTSLVRIATKMQGHAGPHCERVSHGCDRCYSDTNNGRCLPSNGTGLPFDRRARDLVDPFVDEKILLHPLKWRAPKRIFVENQSDLFGEWVSDDAIDRVFAVIALCPQHTFQVLTKRPERMLAYLTNENTARRIAELEMLYRYTRDFNSDYEFDARDANLREWPLKHLWVGISCEDKKTADERIPLLLQTPAAVRYVSYEPALGPVDFDDTRDWLTPNTAYRTREMGGCMSVLNWVIVGGESGPGARPFDIAWARSVIQQCKDAQVACFLKQLGADPREGNANGNCRDVNCTHPDCGYVRMKMKDRKGGDMLEWPEDLRVREFPELHA